MFLQKLQCNAIPRVNLIILESSLLSKNIDTLAVIYVIPTASIYVPLNWTNLSTLKKDNITAFYQQEPNIEKWRNYSDAYQIALRFCSAIYSYFLFRRLDFRKQASSTLSDLKRPINRKNSRIFLLHMDTNWWERWERKVCLDDSNNS